MHDDESPKSRSYQRRNRTTTCTACKGEVKVRRPSHSGEHYCPKPDCQAAKQRAYRQRRSADKARLDKMNLDQREGYLLEVVARMSRGETPFRDERQSYVFEAALLAKQGRQPCASCGREDAVAGLPHPTVDLEGLCRELQLTVPPKGLAGPVVFQIWPEMLPVVEAKLEAERQAAAAVTA